MTLFADPWVEWAPEHDAWAPVDDADWQVIDRPMRYMRYRRGYRRAQQRVEPGVFEVRFDNRDRSLDPTNRSSPWWPNLDLRRQFRARADIGGTVRTLFRGVWDAIQPEWSMSDAVAVMTGVDRMALLAEMRLSSLFRFTAKSYVPMWWWPMDEGGGPWLYNLGSDAAPALTVGVDFGRESPLPYEAAKAVAFRDSELSYAVVSSTQRLSSDFTVTWVTAGTDVGWAFSQGPAGGTGNMDIATGIASTGPVGHPFVTIYDGGAPAVSLDGPAPVNDGAPHIVTVSYDGLNILSMTVDQGAKTTAAVGLFVPRAGQIILGNSPDFDRGFANDLAHVMTWNFVVPDLSIEALHSAALEPWAFQTTSERAASLADMVGVAAADRSFDTTSALMGPSRLDRPALDAFRVAAATEQGLFLVDRYGDFAFYGKDHVGAAGGRYNTRSAGTSDYGLRDVGIDMDRRTFFTVARPTVATPQPTPVEYRHPNADRYGEVVWPPDGDTEYPSVDAAADAGRLVVGDAKPVPHLTNAVTIMDAANALELVSLDVWDTMTVVAHVPDESGAGPFMTWGSGVFWGGTPVWGGAGPIEQLARILEVEHEMDGVKWTATRQLEPA